MMTPLPSLTLFFTASIVLLLTPGPAVLYIVTRAIDQGRKAGIVSVLGIASGGLFHVAAATLGVSALLMSSALLFDIVKYAGAAYLIFLGVKRLVTKQDLHAAQHVEKKSLGQVYRQGVLVNLLNPKTALFFFAFLPQFVDPSRGAIAPQIFVLGLTFLAMAMITDSTYALTAGTFGRWLKGNIHFLRFERYVAGVVYIGLGITAALSSHSQQQ